MAQRIIKLFYKLSLMGGQLVPRETRGPRAMCPGGQFKGGTSHPRTPVLLLVSCTDPFQFFRKWSGHETSTTSTFKYLFRKIFFLLFFDQLLINFRHRLYALGDVWVCNQVTRQDRVCQAWSHCRVVYGDI